MNPSRRSTHVPPFRHGWLAHSSLSIITHKLTMQAMLRIHIWLLQTLHRFIMHGAPCHLFGHYVITFDHVCNSQMCILCIACLEPSGTHGRDEHFVTYLRTDVSQETYHIMRQLSMTSGRSLFLVTSQYLLCYLFLEMHQLRRPITSVVKWFWDHIPLHFFSRPSKLHVPAYVSLAHFR